MAIVVVLSDPGLKAKQEGDTRNTFFYVLYGKNVVSARMSEVSLFISRNGAPSGKEFEVKGQMTNQDEQQMSTPPSVSERMRVQWSND